RKRPKVSESKNSPQTHQNNQNNPALAQNLGDRGAAAGCEIQFGPRPFGPEEGKKRGGATTDTDIRVGRESTK
ncbi:hypothetical protein, partial [Escherichia coli]|uniref:hypothetical protein n=1 Tax=Escherichia coli TaxID=562 RepID=UPI001BDD7782